MFMSEKIARANGEPPPANQRAIIRYMLGQPLDFDPGARYAYSNFGYCVLGRIIEKISGLGYAAWVQQDVLAPIGIRRMRQGFRARRARRGRSQVLYAGQRLERRGNPHRALHRFLPGGDGFPRRLAGLGGGFGPFRGGAG
jgi:CubicO group peptidase (beta-lactamase class C family)